MRFVKGHGSGNDFVLLPDLENRIVLSAPLVRALCRPHTGLGADGVIRVAPARTRVEADVFMDYWNADGSVAEMCGNGVRCVAKYVVDRRMVDQPMVRIDTRSGVKPVDCVLDSNGLVASVRVDMGLPASGKVGHVIALDSAEHAVTTLSMGNPHAVLVVDDVGAAPVETLGHALQQHPEFPDGTNVEFIEVVARDRLRGRIFERGVGETLASGTGASAMAVAAALLDLSDRVVTVELPGGSLDVAWTDSSLFVTGAAMEVAEGTLSPAWLAAVESA